MTTTIFAARLAVLGPRGGGHLIQDVPGCRSECRKLSRRSILRYVSTPSAHVVVLCSHPRRMAPERASPLSNVSQSSPSVTRPATGHGARTDRSPRKLRPKRRRLLASVRRSVCAVMVCENCPRVSSRLSPRRAGTPETSFATRFRSENPGKFAAPPPGCRTFTATARASEAGPAPPTAATSASASTPGPSPKNPNGPHPRRPRSPPVPPSVADPSPAAPPPRGGRRGFPRQPRVTREGAARVRDRAPRAPSRSPVEARTGTPARSTPTRRVRLENARRRGTPGRPVLSARCEASVAWNVGERRRAARSWRRRNPRGTCRVARTPTAPISPARRRTTRRRSGGTPTRGDATPFASPPSRPPRSSPPRQRGRESAQSRGTPPRVTEARRGKTRGGTRA